MGFLSAQAAAHTTTQHTMMMNYKQQQAANTREGLSTEKALVEDLQPYPWELEVEKY